MFYTEFTMLNNSTKQLCMHERMYNYPYSNYTLNRWSYYIMQMHNKMMLNFHYSVDESFLCTYILHFYGTCNLKIYKKTVIVAQEIMVVINISSTK